jgi:DNA-binding HxlR family transcriptional regulator
VADAARSRSDGIAAKPAGGEKVRPAAEVTETNPVGFDQLIHGRVRLGIVSALAVEESLSFNELKERLETSDGNLSVHARRLEEAGYLEVTKSFDRRIPRTDYRLTEAGRRALKRYLDHMEALIERVRE